MTRSRKLLVSIVSVLLSVLVFVSTDMSAEASGYDSYLDTLNTGISAILDHTTTDCSDIITETAEKLNLNLDSATEEEIVEEKVSKLVMANVKSSLNIRVEPQSDAEKVGRLYKNCGGVILERKDGWTKIQSGNVVGWADDKFLLFGEEAEALAASVGVPVIKVNTAVLNVRREANADAEVLGQITINYQADILNTDTEGWICINYEGEAGYVVADYVDLDFKIDVGETMAEIEKREAEEAERARYKQYDAFEYDEETLTLFAALIHCEARGESYEGQVAVASVVMNRVRSHRFPNTIRDVIYSPRQFTPACDGTLDKVLEKGYIQASCFEAAKEALSGYSNVGDRLFFRTNNGRDGLVIGNHVFY